MNCEYCWAYEECNYECLPDDLADRYNKEEDEYYESLPISNQEMIIINKHISKTILQK